MAKKFIHQTEEWGNIELPGLSDAELYTKDWTKVRDSAELVQTEKWKTAYSQGIQNRNSSNIGKSNYKRYEDPTYCKEHNERMRIRTESKEWQDKVKANGVKRRKRVMTPDGIFESRALAAEHYKVWPARIGVFIKTRPDEFYYIE